MAIFPDDYPYIAPAWDDLALMADASNANLNWKCTIEDFTKAWMADSTSDFLPEWTTNLYQTPTEKAKLAWIQAWAQVNQVNSVQWTQWNVLLDLDMIPDWLSRKAWNVPFNTARDNELSTAYVHSQQIGNPHMTTPTEIWLGNVTNDKQLSTTAWNFDALPEKPDVQQHLEDLYVLQDSSDNKVIKSVKNQTMLIWHSSLIQERWPSINYYRFDFVESTTYHLRSLVLVWSWFYKCQVSHQSSWSFASDLAMWYWTPVWGGGWGWNELTSWNWAPTWSWVNPWDVYVDYTNGDLYYWDWTSWILYSSWWTWWVNYTTPTTLWNKLTKSIWLNSDLIEETWINVDASNNVTWINDLTIDWNTILNWQVDINNWPVNFNGVDVNIDGWTVNVTNNTVVTYDNTTTVNLDWTTNISNLNVTNLVVSWWVIENVISVNTNTLLTANESVVLVDATWGDVTITPITAVWNSWKRYVIKKIDSSVNLVIVDWLLTETIDWVLFENLTTQWEVITIISNWVNRFRI